MNKYILFIFLVVETTLSANAQNSLCDPVLTSEPHLTVLGYLENIDTATHGSQQPTDLPDTWKHQKSSKDTRLVYFVHGLGGSELSWDAVDDAHTSEYVYTPVRVDYEHHQRDFNEASLAVYLDMNKLRAEALSGANGTLSTDKPYAIGHSQGGLVLRDMDMKYSSNYDQLFTETNRQFHGIITFGTPHGGASIATAQNELSQLADDFSTILGNAVIKGELADLTVKYPFLAKSLNSISTSAEALVDELGSTFITEGIKTLSKGQQAPMTKQYTPESNYLNNTLDFSNPSTPKALFYGRESDPLLFKIATYMIGPAASDFVAYERFGANDDQAIAENIKQIRANLKVDAINHQRQVQEITKRLNRTNIPVVGLLFLPARKNKLEQLYVHQQAIAAENQAISFIEKVNPMYKRIVGIGVSPANQVKRITGYWCITGNRIVIGSDNNPFEHPIKHWVKDKSLCEGEIAIPIYQNATPDRFSDAVVLESSQKAFPGCPERYKNMMDEYRMYDEHGNLVTIKQQGDVNHIQMLNCNQTEEALRRIYEGRGVPSFFKLEKKP